MPVYLNGVEFETLAEYEARIRDDISNWNWKNVSKYAEPIEDEEGNPMWCFYLGSCLALNFSGKYYLPFACSNVDYCEYCNGRGHVGWGMCYNMNWNVEFRRGYINEYACPVCDCMGNLEWYRCEDCGADFDVEIEQPVPAFQFRWELEEV